MFYESSEVVRFTHPDHVVSRWIVPLDVCWNLEIINTITYVQIYETEIIQYIFEIYL